LKRKFFDYSFDVDFTSEDYDTNSSRYTVRFSINITGGNVTSEPAFISGHVTVDKTTNDISLIYDKSVDTTMLSGESYE
jgi:helix-turn-helix protein